MTAVKTEIGAETPSQRVPHAPTTSIPKTDVWAAIKYVYDTLVASVAAHLADTSDAHDASAISFSPTGSIAATDVQAAIAELGTEKEPLDADLTTIAGLTPSNDDVLQRKASAWANRTIAQLLTDLAAPGTTFQPLDADLTAIAAVTTTTFGRALLALADDDALAALIDSFFLTPTEGNAAYQPLDADLTAIAALTTTTFGRAFLALADEAAFKAAVNLEIGTDVQAYDADTAKIDVAQNWTAQQRFGPQAISSSSNATAWDVSTRQVATLTMTENTTVTASNIVAGTFYTLKVIQGASAYTLAWDGAFKWAGGIAPTLSTGNGDVDVLTFYSDGTNLYGSFLQDFS